MLLNRGRSTSAQLAQRTGLTPRQLRHGLAVLLQHSLVFYLVEESRLAVYEANADAAYSLVRSGKILEMVEARYGLAAKDVVQSLLALGHTRVADLVSAYEAQIRSREKAKHISGEDSFVDEMMQSIPSDDLSHIKSASHLDAVLCQLLEGDIIQVVTRNSFISPSDQHEMVIGNVKKHFTQEPKGTKQKKDYEDQITDGLRTLRDEPLTMKRSLVGATFTARAKLRKLANGDKVNGSHDAHYDALDVSIAS
jgi:DNA-directed RNA polymerase III subunit RPC3